MAEGYYGDEAHELSSTVESLAIHDQTERDATALYHGLESLPNEMIFKMLENLPPLYDPYQPAPAGSEALASATEGLNALQALCRVSKQMEMVAKPYLYQSIVISDQYKLMQLLETLDKSPELGNHVRSLNVYRDFDLSDIEPQTHLNHGMSLRRFSEAFVAVLKKTPELTMLSLNCDRETSFLDSDPFEMLSVYLQRDIRRAKDAIRPQEFLPKVETLGIILSPGGPSQIQRAREFDIFKGLLNLPTLSNIVVRRPIVEDFISSEGYRHLLNQREARLRSTIKSIDLQIDRWMCWDDVGGIGVWFPSLHSLTLRHRGHEPSTIHVQPDLSNLPRMECLRHLSIDITSPVAWFPCEWFLESIKSQFRLAPRLESLRIPLRLFRAPVELETETGPVLHPGDVLPVTLESLALVADLQVYKTDSWDLVDGHTVRVEDEDGNEVPYTIGCRLAVPWVVKFLSEIGQVAQNSLPRLRELTLEYEINLIDHPDAVDVNDMLIGIEGAFVSRLQALQESLAQGGIRFKWTKV